jgi:hypothetical protein
MAAPRHVRTRSSQQEWPALLQRFKILIRESAAGGIPPCVKQELR